ncbi:Somatostatin receptor type 1 [Branchiostoma belcheri]|nr:Somatostatin receptor type 1 [Branchiostoma belcheri]
MSSLSMYDVYYVVGDFTISLIGIAANLFVVFLVVRCAALRTAPNVYVASLAVTDFTFCLWNLLTYIRTFFGAFDVNRIIAVFLLNASIFLLVAIAVERYKAIVSPLEHLLTSTLGRAVGTCFLAVLAALVAATLDTVGRLAVTNDWGFTGKSIDNETKVLLNIQSTDVNDPLFLLALVEFLIGYVTPACTSLFLYVRIFMKLRQSQRLGARVSGDHAFRMVLVVTLFFLICCLPIHIINFNAHFFISNQLDFFSFAKIMIILNSVGNPFLYALLGKNFRLQIKRMFCCSSCKGNLRMRRASFSNAAGTEPSAPNVQVLRVLQVSRDALEEADVEVVTAKIEEDKTEMEDVGEGIGMAEDVGKKVEETEEETGIDKDVEKAIGLLEDVEEERRKLEETEEDTSIAEGVLKEIREMKERKEDTGIAKDVLKKIEEMEFEERKEGTDVAEDVEKEKRELKETEEDTGMT